MNFQIQNCIYALFLFYISSYICHGEAEQQETKFISRDWTSQMVIPIIGMYTVRSKIECTMACLRDPLCWDVMVTKVGTGHIECLLMDDSASVGTRSMWKNVTRVKLIAKSCQDILTNGGVQNGLYSITVFDVIHGPKNIQVYCDQETEGGGWLVFQRRQNGIEDFYRNWADYADGFGDHEAEFWLGNHLLNYLTSNSTMTLRVDLGDFNNNYTYAKYTTFSVGSEESKFVMTISGYSGDAGDGLQYHNNMMFSTKDQDNDASSEVQTCAEEYMGAWWYNYCHKSNLNGQWYAGGSAPNAKGVIWDYYINPYSMKFSEMKIRPL